MSISDDQYNRARAILIEAGSRTASSSHAKHTQGRGSPVGHGQQLLREARDEFREADRQSGSHSGMTEAHYKAIHRAAQEMGISNW